jgi:hypothetical protein
MHVVLSIRTANSCLHFRYFVIIECDMSVELYQRTMKIYQLRAFFSVTTNTEDFEPPSESFVPPSCTSM